jgi:hypothetical protein
MHNISILVPLANGVIFGFVVNVGAKPAAFLASSGSPKKVQVKKSFNRMPS